MRRILLAVLIMFAFQPTAAAVAGSPDPHHSGKQWFQPVQFETVIGVCPLGDWSALDVTLGDQNSQPVAGWDVSLVFADPRICSGPMSGVTDANGFVRLVIKAGLDGSTGASRVTSGYSVYVGGYAMWTGTVSLLSVDYNCNQKVEGLDFTFFSLDWTPAAYAPRSDFNNDGAVDALDLSIFALHWLHAY